MENQNLPGQPTTAHPRTKAQRLASARNGALSRGPVTAEGKERSSLNAITHGLRAQDVILTGEMPESFQEMNDRIVARLAPRDEVEAAFVESFVMARWRQHRAWHFESMGMNEEIARQNDPNPAAAGWNAWASLCEGKQAFQLLNRYESRHRRDMSQSLRQLCLYRSGLLPDLKPELPNEPERLQPAVSSMPCPPVDCSLTLESAGAATQNPEDSRLR